MDPQTGNEWMDVARARLEEARSLQAQVPASVGSAYLSGYGVECALKACAVYHGGHASRQHDLVNLLKQAGIKPSSIKAGAWLLSAWAVDWRYFQHDAQLPESPSACLKAAGDLQGFITKTLQRKARKSQRRGK